MEHWLKRSGEQIGSHTQCGCRRGLQGIQEREPWQPPLPSVLSVHPAALTASGTVCARQRLQGREWREIQGDKSGKEYFICFNETVSRYAAQTDFQLKILCLLGIGGL